MSRVVTIMPLPQTCSDPSPLHSHWSYIPWTWQVAGEICIFLVWHRDNFPRVYLLWCLFRLCSNKSCIYVIMHVCRNSLRTSLMNTWNTGSALTSPFDHDQVFIVSGVGDESSFPFISLKMWLDCRHSWGLVWWNTWLFLLVLCLRDPGQEGHDNGTSWWSCSGTYNQYSIWVHHLSFQWKEAHSCRRCGWEDNIVLNDFGFSWWKGHMPLGGMVPSRRSMAQSQGISGGNLEALDLLNTSLGSE